MILIFPDSISVNSLVIIPRGENYSKHELLAILGARYSSK